MRVFLTGASGFIGRHLLPLLDKHEVACLGHGTAAAAPSAAASTIRGDLNRPDSYRHELERFKPECCIHLAWEGLPDYSFSKCRANLTASLELFEILGVLGCRTIFASGTCWEYGGLSGSGREDPEGRDPTLFAAFKSGLETIGRGLATGYG